MALTAVWQRAVVNIVFLVTEFAVVAHAGEMALIPVAFGAFEAVVHAREFKVLVEIAGFFPSLLGMAFRASGSELALVYVLVAGFAVVSL